MKANTNKKIPVCVVCKVRLDPTYDLDGETVLNYVCRNVQQDGDICGKRYDPQGNRIYPRTRN